MKLNSINSAATMAATAAIALLAVLLWLTDAATAQPRRPAPGGGGEDYDLAANIVPPQFRPGQRGAGPPVPVEVRLRVFIPAPAVSLVNILGVNDLFNLGCMATRVVNFDTCLFRGDGRGFSYAAGTQRVLANVVMDPGGGATEHLFYCRTHEFRPDAGVAGRGKPWWWFDLKPGATAFANKRLRVDQRNEGIVINNLLNHTSTIRIKIRGKNPLVIGPPIDAEMTVFLLYPPGQQMVASVEGWHDYFPAYELYVNGVLMRGEGLPYNPAETFLASPYSLLGAVLPRQRIYVTATNIPRHFTPNPPAISAACR